MTRRLAFCWAGRSDSRTGECFNLFCQRRSDSRAKRGPRNQSASIWPPAQTNRRPKKPSRSRVPIHSRGIAARLKLDCLRGCRGGSFRQTCRETPVCPMIFGLRLFRKRLLHVCYPGHRRRTPRQGSSPGRGETRSAARRGTRKSPAASGGEARLFRSASASLRISTSGSLNCPLSFRETPSAGTASCRSTCKAMANCSP